MNMKRKVIVSALTALILACVCALSGCSGKTVIDLTDYVSVDFFGYSGDGSASVFIDRSGMLPLLKDQSAAEQIANDFSVADIANNGKLSNGDKINVTVKFSEKMMENAKISVQNPTLSFDVSGLKEKEKLDVFAGVEFTSAGTSPECTVSVKYNGGSPYGKLELQTENGEIIKDNFDKRYFKNDEKITLRISETALEQLRTEYIIEETSRDYTVKTDSSYILTAADLTDEHRKSLDKIAEDLVKEKIDDITNYRDRAAVIKLYSQASGVNEGKLYAGITNRINKLQLEKLNSAYVGVGDVSGSWGSKKSNQKSIYYIFDADFSYYLKDYSTVYEDEVVCALIVRIDDPRITPEGVMYSGLTFGSAKDFQSAYNSYITSKFEKLP